MLCESPISTNQFFPIWITFALTFHFYDKNPTMRKKQFIVVMTTKVQPNLLLADTLRKNHRFLLEGG